MYAANLLPMKQISLDLYEQSELWKICEGQAILTILKVQIKNEFTVTFNGDFITSFSHMHSM